MMLGLFAAERGTSLTPTSSCEGYAREEREIRSADAAFSRPYRTAPPLLSTVSACPPTMCVVGRCERPSVRESIGFGRVTSSASSAAEIATGKSEFHRRSRTEREPRERSITVMCRAARKRSRARSSDSKSSAPRSLAHVAPPPARCFAAVPPFPAAAAAP